MSNIIFFDRSRVVTDWKCPRARFWNYEFGGRGLAPARNAIALEDGIAVHDGIAQVLAGGDPREVSAAQGAKVRDLILTDKVEEGGLQREAFANEQACLTACMILAFDRVVKPRLLRGHTIVAIEESVVYEFKGLTMAVKPDVLLRRDDDGTLWYPEFKTTGIMSSAYFESWHYAVQLQATIKAISEARGEPLEGAVIHALYKGVQKDGRQMSPFTYAYERKGQLQYTYSPGTTRVPVWENVDLVEWVGRMPEEVIEAQFAETPPIFVNDLLATEFFEQRALREKEIRAARIWMQEHPQDASHMLREVFPQAFSSCRPAFGPACAFRNLCFIPQVGAAPLRSGEFKWRTPHHELEPVDVAPGE